MSQRTRVLIAIGIVVVLAVAVLVIDALRSRSTPAAPGPAPTLVPGSVPIYLNGELVGGFSPADLVDLDKAGFLDAEDGVQQEGWLLKDVLLLRLDADELSPNTSIIVSSSSRDKSAQLTWEQVSDLANKVMFDLSNRGTLKLVSLLESLDTRNEWVQDVDKIEVETR